MKEFSLPIVGIDFPNPDRSGSNRRSELLMTPPGTPLALRAEPGNPHDPHAIAVFASNGIQVGYLPAERAPYIGARLRRGDPVSAIFQALGASGAALRIRIGGGEPTLPPPVVAGPAQPADEWASDPDGSDWGA